MIAPMAGGQAMRITGFGEETPQSVKNSVATIKHTVTAEAILSRRLFLDLATTMTSMSTNAKNATPGGQGMVANMNATTATTVVRTSKRARLNCIEAPQG
ncbi:hypothetical protein HG15A2_46530 [Adhaeretor mobilis]|uniref:Uncharacterized protein n=1 Tax=Adhaeretor mobilis TaxID=1930276 RepID=A0A517N2F8_9BACT|nr:hypothetical protein HG15A2_46530 [Adhaeretor mobilis]